MSSDRSFDPRAGFGLVVRVAVLVGFSVALGAAAGGLARLGGGRSGPTLTAAILGSGGFGAFLGLCSTLWMALLLDETRLWKSLPLVAAVTAGLALLMGFAHPLLVLVTCPAAEFFAALLARRLFPARGWLKPWLCGACGYDLRGLPGFSTGAITCPECGTAAAMRRVERNHRP